MMRSFPAWTTQCRPVTLGHTTTLPIASRHGMLSQQVCFAEQRRGVVHCSQIRALCAGFGPRWSWVAPYDHKPMSSAYVCPTDGQAKLTVDSDQILSLSLIHI